MGPYKSLRCQSRELTAGPKEKREGMGPGGREGSKGENSRGLGNTEIDRRERQLGSQTRA